MGSGIGCWFCLWGLKIRVRVKVSKVMGLK